MPKVYNKWKHDVPKDAVYIGRPTEWGNPYVIGEDGTREEVIAKYREWLFKRPALMQRAREELAGKDLWCYCSPAPCHGDVLLFVANVSELPIPKKEFVLGKP